MNVNQLNNKCGDYRLIFDNVSLYAGDKVILEQECFNIIYFNIVILKVQIGSWKIIILKAIAGINKLISGSIFSYNKNNENAGAVYVHSQPELNFLTGYIKDELKILGIKDYSPFEKYLNKSIYELSGGALKKISLLMALHISSGRIILSDEPLDMLDDIEAENLSKVIIEYSKHTPFIIATHDKHFDKYADVLISL